MIDISANFGGPPPGRALGIKTALARVVVAIAYLQSKDTKKSVVLPTLPLVFWGTWWRRNLLYVGGLKKKFTALRDTVLL